MNKIVNLVYTKLSIQKLIRNTYAKLNQFSSFLEQSDASKFTVAGRLQKKAQSPVELQFERGANAAAKKCPLQTIRSANQPQLGLAKSPSMMVTSSTNGNYAAASGPRASHGALFVQRSLSVNNEVAANGSESNSASNSDSDNEKDQKDKRNINNQTSTTISPSHGNGVRGARIVVPKFDDDETFEKFFVSKKSPTGKSTPDEEGIDIADFDKIKPTER